MKYVLLIRQGVIAKSAKYFRIQPQTGECYVVGITTVQLVPISYADTKHGYPPTTGSSHVPASTVKAYMQQFRDRKSRQSQKKLMLTAVNSQ